MLMKLQSQILLRLAVSAFVGHRRIAGQSGEIDHVHDTDQLAAQRAFDLKFFRRLSKPIA